MVVHPGPGNYSGTLVNALLHRFGMPAVRLEPDQESEDPELSDSGTPSLCSLFCSRQPSFDKQSFSGVHQDLKALPVA